MLRKIKSTAIFMFCILIIHQTVILSGQEEEEQGEEQEEEPEQEQGPQLIKIGK